MTISKIIVGSLAIVKPGVLSRGRNITNLSARCINLETAVVHGKSAQSFYMLNCRF